MKPLLIRSNQSVQPKLEIDCSAYQFFYNPWHFHPELELTLVVKSYGQRQVGDSIENFYPGDLVLVGSNLPHVWKNDQSFLLDENKKDAAAVVVKFSEDFAGKEFMNLPEMRVVKDLILKKATFGVKLTGGLRDDIEKEIRLLCALTADELLIKVLQLLLKIAKSNEYILLASNLYKKETLRSNHRINKVLDHIMDNYHQNLTLDELAEIIHMNKNAFCKFFKNSMGNTLFTVINEIRIAKACQQLLETEKSVLQISLDVGFTNLSNFNRVFKKQMKKAPLFYRRSTHIIHN